MMCWARTVFVFVVIALGVLSMLNACGQKGDLYLPERTPSAPAPRGNDVPTVPPAPAQSGDRADQPSS